MADSYAQFTGKSDVSDGSSSALAGTTKQVGRGVLEAVPFVGEKMATGAGLPEPKNWQERLTKRAATNLPYALAAGATGVGAIPAAVGFVGATGLGQAAEELGVSKPYQPVFEMLGGGLAPLTKDVSGRVLGYIQPQLEELYKKGTKLNYEFGPGARTSQGMKYGSGENPTAAIQNLEKFTEEATARAGNPSKVIDANWIKNTGDNLGTTVNRIFSGQTFQSSPTFVNEVNNLAKEAESAFGQQGNVVKTILEKNIGGQRAGGKLVDPQFAAEDLRKAIVEVNGSLSNATGNQARILHDLKDSLEKVAETNLNRIDKTGKLAQEYNQWRKEYNSFATIRDINQLFGRTGVTAAGQINPSKLLDVVTNRTGGVATRSPLYSDLAELGDIMKVKEIPLTGVTKGMTQFFTESPLAKALQTSMQPRLATKGSKAGYVQPLAPLEKYTQIGGDSSGSKDPYSQFTGGK